jgi:hypothetical protein
MVVRVPAPGPSGDGKVGKIAVYLQIAVTLIVLPLVLWIIICRPTMVYAPSARVVLYLLVSIVPAVLFATVVAAQFEMKLPGFTMTAGGAFAGVLIVFVLLNHFSKPEEQIAAFQVVGENGDQVTLEAAGTVSVVGDDASRGLTPTYCVDGDKLLMIFPEQLAAARVTIKHPGSGVIYRGRIEYAGTKTSELALGKDLLRQRAQ